MLGFDNDYDAMSLQKYFEWYLTHLLYSSSSVGVQFAVGVPADKVWILEHLMLYLICFCLLNDVSGTGAHCWRANHVTSRARDDSTGGRDLCCWDCFPHSQVLLSFLQTYSLSQFSNYISKYIHRGDISSEYFFGLTFFYSRLNKPGQSTPHEDNNDEQDFLQSTPQPVCRQPIKKTRWGHPLIFAKSTFN